MSRPLLEVADLVRSAGAAFIGRNQAWIRWTHIKVLLAIARCRTAALGGHIDECTRCGHRATISYNSCRNRHCPKCQTGARERWIEARRSELLPSPYVHVVFTLPPQLAALALQNKKVIYGLLLRASAETLLEVARNPTHLGAEIGFSVCSTPGTRSSRFILMSTALFLPAGSRSITPAGFDLTRASFSPFPCSGRCFAASSSTLSSWPFSEASCIFPGICCDLRNPNSSPPGCDPCFAKTGWSIQATLRRPRVCAPVSRSLHSPCRHFQSSTGLVGQPASHLSLARLRSQQ